MSEQITEQEYLEDNIATVAFHLGRPGARLSVQSGMGTGLLVEPGEVLKEISRRLTVKPDGVDRPRGRRQWPRQMSKRSRP